MCACVRVNGVGMVGRAEGKKINSNKAIKIMKLSGKMVVFLLHPRQAFFIYIEAVRDKGGNQSDRRKLPSFTK